VQVCLVAITIVNASKHTCTHCSTLQHTATHCNTLQYTATHLHTIVNATKHTCKAHLNLDLLEASTSVMSADVHAKRDSLRFTHSKLEKDKLKETTLIKGNPCVQVCLVASTIVCKCVAVYCRVLQGVAVCCSVLQCVVVCAYACVLLCVVV